MLAYFFRLVSELKFRPKSLLTARNSLEVIVEKKEKHKIEEKASEDYVEDDVEVTTYESHDDLRETEETLISQDIMSGNY